VFIFPGANETFGNVVLEAMASGLPVVVPDSGGVLDFVSNDVNGLLFESENPDSLVEQAGRLIEQPALRRSLAASARLVVNNRSWSDVFDKLFFDYARAIKVAHRSYRSRVATEAKYYGHSE
jgi:glycosyltransferase involved in cell wall biosynthesis